MRQRPRELHWDSRSHFFAAAAEAGRRILVERVRHKATCKRGANALRLDLVRIEVACDERPHELLRLDEAVQELERHDAQAARLVKLRFFAGLTQQQAAEALGISRRAADRVWALAWARLYQQIGGPEALSTKTTTTLSNFAKASSRSRPARFSPTTKRNGRTLRTRCSSSASSRSESMYMAPVTLIRPGSIIPDYR